MNNILETCEEYCSGCGLCETVCPVNAICVENADGKLRPSVNEKCIECGKCKKVCPNLCMEAYAYDQFKYYTWGHSRNKKLRLNAASGGITSELLYYLVEKKYVDYVVTADEYFNDGNCQYCSLTGTEIYNKAGSNYCPVNIGRAIKVIKEREGNCAIVCLPCLARGIRKLCEQDITLKNKVKYVITLLCNHVPTYNATEYLKRKYKVDEPDLIKYRGNGWFGFLRFFKKNWDGCNISGYSEYFSSGYSEYFSSGFSNYFWQKACILCNDHFGKYSDIAMGDADFIKYRSDDENTGETICFINNMHIKKILFDMYNDGIIELSTDVVQEEMEEIYGPLCKENSVNTDSLRQDYKKVLREEKWHSMKNVIRIKIYKLKKRIKNGK